MMSMLYSGYQLPAPNNTEKQDKREKAITFINRKINLS